MIVLIFVALAVISISYGNVLTKYYIYIFFYISDFRIKCSYICSSGYYLMLIIASDTAWDA